MDPTDVNYIEKFVFGAIDGKLRRKDYSKFASKYCDSMTAKDIRRMAAEQRLDDEIFVAVHRIAEDVSARIQAQDLQLPPVRYQQRLDGMTRKVRLIGIEPIIQQVIEHVAVGCLQELWDKKLAFYQFASIEGKGQVRGAKAIQKWTKTAVEKPSGNRPAKRAHYFVKLDVRRCFQSITHDRVMAMLRRDIGKNKVLLWLVEELLKNHGDGLIIGSLLSQFLANYVLSYAYRFVMGLHKERRGKKIRLIYHALFYMDDILLMGTDRRNVLMAARALVRYMRRELGLEIKPNWHVKDHNLEPIDMMGFTVYGNGRVAIRKRVFLRARRTFIRAIRKPQTLKSARRCCSYYGYFKHSNVQRNIQIADGTTFDVPKIKEASATIISIHDKEVKANESNGKLFTAA